MSKELQAAIAAAEREGVPASGPQTPDVEALGEEWDKAGVRCEYKIGIGPEVEGRVTELLEEEANFESAICPLRAGNLRHSCLIENNHGSAKVFVKVSASYDQLSVSSCIARKTVGGLNPCQGIR